uniref:UFSP N-terminal MPN domain-containing protein n=1 Tax=Caenorhabditis japonica TaxID=281687 RepID=A0A8R1EIM8_CAEJA
MSKAVAIVGAQMAASQAPVSEVKELWFIDVQALFQNYANLRSFAKTDEAQTTIGGLVFGRKARKQVIHVFFAYAEDLIDSNLQFLLSSLSAGGF